MAEAQQQGGIEDLWKFLRTGKTMSAKDLAEAPDVQTLLNKARAETFVEEDLPGVEPNSSDRTPDVVAANPSYRNPYSKETPTRSSTGPGGIPLAPQYVSGDDATPMSPDTTGPGGIPLNKDYVSDSPLRGMAPGAVGKYRFNPMLIEGNLPKKGSKHSIDPDKGTAKSGSSRVSPPIMDVPGAPSPGPAAENDPGSKTTTIKSTSTSVDTDKIIAALQKYLGGPTDEKWDLSPAIAWADSISGNNVLKGYKRPKSREEIIKDRQDLAIKMAAITERADHHDKMSKKGLKNYADIIAWNEQHKREPEKQLNPFTGQPFQKNDPFDAFLKEGFRQGIKDKADSTKNSEQTAIDERLGKENPGFIFKNGIPHSVKGKSGSAADRKVPTPSIAEIKDGAESTFIGIYQRPFNKDDPGDTKFMGTLRKLHSDALAEAKKSGGNYYDIVDAKKNDLIGQIKAKQAKDKANAEAQTLKAEEDQRKKDAEPGLLDKIQNYFKGK